MSMSENISELCAALSKAQGQMQGAIKDSANPFFKSKYADLASVTDAIREAFAANGLSYIQKLSNPRDGDVGIETILMHSSGQWMSGGILTVPVTKHDPQGYGSAITYARRYSLSAISGVAPAEDDGEAARLAAVKDAMEKAKAKTTPMPEKVKAAAKAVTQPKVATITGNPDEGDLSHVGTPEPADQVAIDKVLAAFLAIGRNEGEVEKLVGKKCDDWMQSDIVVARAKYKTTKAEVDARHAAEDAEENGVL